MHFGDDYYSAAFNSLPLLPLTKLETRHCHCLSTGVLASQILGIQCYQVKKQQPCTVSGLHFNVREAWASNTVVVVLLDASALSALLVAESGSAV